MGKISVAKLGKAYKHYPTHWSRLREWLTLGKIQCHQLNWILRDLNFNVESGEAVGIIGINGAGKSTLLKLITGTTQPTTGSVNVTGRLAAMLELGMGFHPDFTGRQNALMAGQLLGMSNAEIEQHMDGIEEFAEIGSYIDEPVRVYSSGMQVRLAFGVATAIRPDILIIDEALSVGDGYFQQKCFARIRDMQEKGTTLVFVSHDVAALSAFCQKIIWLENGQLKRYGDTKTVLEEYTEDLFKRKQDTRIEKDKGFSLNESRHTHVEKNKNTKLRDMRLDVVARSNLRNDIEVFNNFYLKPAWGDGKVRLLETKFQNIDGHDVSWIVGGERLRLSIICECKEKSNDLIFGFLVKDKYGQNIFGDNTYLTNIKNSVAMNPGEIAEVVFEYQMPIMPVGIYSVTVAIVSGAQENYRVLEWKDDAISFESHNSWSNSGLVGIPMDNIHINIRRGV